MMARRMASRARSEWHLNFGICAKRRSYGSPARNVPCHYQKAEWPEEFAMKLVYLRDMVRRLSAVLIVSTVASPAQASMTCTRFDEFPAVSDPSIREQLETHVRALPGLKNYKIRSLDGRFFIVTSDGRFCKDIPRCEHRLLDRRNGVVRDVFAFRGTGITWRLWSPLSAWMEDLQDEYSAWAFVTTEETFIRVDLPRSGDMVVIDSPGPEETKTLQACAHVK